MLFDIVPPNLKESRLIPMANIFDKFIDSMRLSDDEEDEDDLFVDEEEEEDEFEDERPARKGGFFSRFGNKGPVHDIPEEEDEPVDGPDNPEPPVSAKPKREAPRPGGRGNGATVRTGGRGMEVCMIKPANFDDSREICETLLSGRAVVINMEGLHIEIAQRIIDFVSGACFSMGGNLQMISKYVFIVTPKSVELSGDFQDIVALTDDTGLSSVSFSLNQP